MEKKKRKYKYLLLGSSIALLVIFLLVYSLYWSTIIYVLTQIEGTWLATIASIVRIIILGIMSFFLFRKWLKQEAIYTSDAYFLFALFFMVLTFGKIYDLLYNLILISESFGEAVLLYLQKVRFIIVVLNILPILYIGLEAIMTFISVYIKEISKKQFNKLRLWIVIIFLVLVSFIIVTSTSITFLISVLPFLTLAIFVMIAIMFLFMYKNKRLSQANGLIIGLAFLVFIFTNIARSIISVRALSEPSLFVIAETLDIAANFLMFIGFISKPKYAK
ncbi:MAG: hypothetical protein ACFE8J_12955 [Candidatus Heimdallarchaeota archaeon]